MMPLERSKSEPVEVDRRSRPPAGGNGSLNSASGKKRKKKKDKPRGAKIVKNGEKEDRTEPVLSIRSTSSTLVLNGSSVQLKINDRRSSNSSIENSRPTAKVGRFECSSSDGMSIGGQSASSSAVMDACNGDHSITPPQLPSSSLVTKSPAKAAAATAEKTGSQVGRVTFAEGTASSSRSEHEHSTCVNISRDCAMEVVPESLRWDRECSDEETERKRIEIYKENRRKRYENALAERKAQLSLRATNRVKFYIS